MAVYELARGGYAHEYNNPAVDCCKLDKATGLPSFLQPDHKDGYHWMDKVTWGHLLHELERKYDLDVTDLEVGDRLRIFLNPNHATVKSLFFDFRKGVKGFQFAVKSVNGADYETASAIYQSTYTQCGEVETSEVVEEFDMSHVADQTQYVLKIQDGYNAKVDAIELEIVSLPATLATLNDLELQIGRRYEMDGYMMPSIM